MDKSLWIPIFQWLTLLNMALLVVSFVVVLVLKDWINQWHGKWFSLEPQQIQFAIYLMLGIYKILIILLFASPWLVLTLLSG